MNVTHGSMFSGIEGFGLGFQMAGWQTDPVWQSEIDDWCNRLNAKRFPDTKQLGDIRACDDIPKVDVVTAGFPCQPASQAGKGLAQQDPRWLWPHVCRVVEQVQPRILIAENVRGLKARGLADVLHDLAAIGYDAQWDLLPAWAVGAPHLRHRFWIVAYPENQPVGRLFADAPTVYRWPDEEPHKPRLIGPQKNRRARLSSLGNSVVPHAVCYVAQRIDAMVDQELELPSLIGRTLESFDGKPPYAGIMSGGAVYETDTSSPKTSKLRLWPTAAANDAQWGVEALAACVHVNGEPATDPHMRFYHPTTGQIVQRTLHNYVVGVDAGLWDEPADAKVWPTASATDYKGVSRPGQRRRQLEEAVRDEEGLWPTPNVTGGSQRARSPQKLEERSEKGDFLNLADEARLATIREGAEKTPSTLNAGWVEWLMGYPPEWTAA